MARKKDIPGFIYPADEDNGSRAAAHPLRQAAMRLADIRRSGARVKTKDLIGLLVSHGARAWRSSLPQVNVKVRVSCPSGHPAVKIRFQ